VVPDLDGKRLDFEVAFPRHLFRWGRNWIALESGRQELNYGFRPPRERSRDQTSGRASMISRSSNFGIRGNVDVSPFVGFSITLVFLTYPDHQVRLLGDIWQRALSAATFFAGSLLPRFNPTNYATIWCTATSCGTPRRTAFGGPSRKKNPGWGTFDYDRLAFGSLRSALSGVELASSRVQVSKSSAEAEVSVLRADSTSGIIQGTPH